MFNWLFKLFRRKPKGTDASTQWPSFEETTDVPPVPPRGWHKPSRPPWTAPAFDPEQQRKDLEQWRSNLRPPPLPDSDDDLLAAATLAQLASLALSASDQGPHDAESAPDTSSSNTNDAIT